MAPETRVQLCGNFLVRLEGRRVDDELPGAQGRVLFAYLCLNRTRSVTREATMDALWGESLPAAPAVALSALLSKLRRTVGTQCIEGRTALRMALPEPAQVDVELADALLHRAQTALAEGDWAGAWTPSHVILARGFMLGHESPWVDEMRRELNDKLVEGLECAIRSKLGRGGRELMSAEPLARRLVALAPYRESGHAVLMRVLSARGNVAEALRAYNDLRLRLRDELGIAPGPEIQGLHHDLLVQA